MEKKYQGYEELLDADDTAQIEEDIPQPAGICTLFTIIFNNLELSKFCKYIVS